MKLIGETLREASIALYREWHNLTAERYVILREKFGNGSQKKPEKIEEEESEVVCKNIFVEKRKANPPATEADLQKYNPMKFSYSWIMEEGQTE